MASRLAGLQRLVGKVGGAQCCVAVGSLSAGSPDALLPSGVRILDPIT